MNSSILILAAGASSRMGQSKQLLKIGNESLIVKMVNVALEAHPQSVTVVLGAEEKKHRMEIAGLPVEIVSNPNWESGMGSSIKTGMSHIRKNLPETGSVIICVCDQPSLTSSHLNKLFTAYSTTLKPIIASAYAGVVGVPALFDKTMFTALDNLFDGQGARKIILQHPDKTETVDFPEGEIDLDTPEDYQNFLKKNI